MSIRVFASVLTLVGLLLSLSACAGSVTPVTTPSTSTPISTPALSPTATRTPLETPTPTPIPVPTPTPLETPTPAPSPAPTIAVTPAPRLPSGPTPTAPPLEKRVTQDQPDDFPGLQIHLIYAVPSDGYDRAWDIRAEMTTSVAAVQRWFERQTGGQRLRFDTYQGAVDITFLRLDRKFAELSETVDVTLRRLGFAQQNKLYVVYFDTLRIYFSGSLCGQGSSGPPIVMVLLSSACGLEGFAPSADEPRALEFALIHEMLHALGFVAPCAPHFVWSQGAHVNDDPRDLMVATTGPGRVPILDVGHDDYYGHNIQGCPDLQDSLFLEPSPSAASAPLPHLLSRFTV